MALVAQTEAQRTKRPVVNPRLLALETAKEILAEVFGARPSDVEEIMQRIADSNQTYLNQ